VQRHASLLLLLGSAYETPLLSYRSGAFEKQVPLEC
jgi:hypothetical protein